MRPPSTRIWPLSTVTVVSMLRLLNTWLAVPARPAAWLDTSSAIFILMLSPSPLTCGVMPSVRPTVFWLKVVNGLVMLVVVPVEV